MDLETDEPLDILTPLAQHQIQELGSRCDKVSKIVDTKDGAVFTAIQEGVDKANSYASSSILKVSIPCWCPERLGEYEHSKGLKA